MSQDGIITVVVTIDAKSGKPIGEPEIVTRGVVLAEGVDMLDEARQRVAKAVAKTGKEGVTDFSVVQRRIRETLSQFVWERAKRRPMIIPVVMEV